jgi:hypothetical protein
MAAESESLEKGARERNRRYRIFGKCIASVRLQSMKCLTDALMSAPLHRLELWSKECPMEFKEYDTRNPVVQSEDSFLQS